MSLLSRAARNAVAEYRSASGAWMPWSIPTPDGYGVGGREFDQRMALSIATIINCIRVLSDDMGILPFRAYSGDPNGSRIVIKNQPDIVSHPFGDDLSAQGGFGQLTTSLAFRGRAWCYKTEYDRYGYPRQLQILSPDDCNLRILDNGRKVVRVNGLDYDYREFVHLKGLMLPGAIDGVDPLTAQRITWGAAADMNEFGRNLFTNGAVMSGVVEATGATGDVKADRKRARDIAMQFQANHAGVANAHKVGVLFDASWKPMSVTPENAQFLASKAFAREEMAGWFGVPMQRLMVMVQKASQGGGKGLDSIDQGYATHTLLPKARQIETEWDRMIPGGFGTWTAFDFTGMLRAAALERAQRLVMLRTAGIITQNEGRWDEGYGPSDDPRANDLFEPLNSNATAFNLTDAVVGDDDAGDNTDPTDQGTQ